MIATGPTRRERYRQQTLDEIKSTAMQQMSVGGVPAVSLNAIAREMGMSPAALYRYFASRDDLLAELVIDAYGSLADALERAAATNGPATPVRVSAVATAYRDWALAQPNSYRLIFESSTGSGQELAPEQVVPAAQRSMDVFLTVLSTVEVVPVDKLPKALEREIRAWAQRSGNSALSTATLHLGLSWWSRLHGLVSLELGQHLRATGIDPGLLFQAEVRTLLGRLQSPTGPA